ncbi:MAG: ribokinase [Micromonosporaceae bacterium]|nr:ribokinase [Micromonosporaceae bacterium]
MVVVGDLVTDVVAVVAGAPVPGTDTPARIRVTGGGQAANTAAWLAYAGVPVTLVATVGDDPPGRERVAELATAGVDSAVRPVARVPTGTLVVLSAGDDRTMLADRGAAGRLRPADVDAALDRWSATRHLHLSGYALLDRGSRAAGRHALAAAAGRGLTTSVDAASAGPLRRVGPARFLGWVRGVDLLLANAAEAALLTAGTAAGGPADPVSCARALAGAATAAVVKLGSAGALWAGSGGVVRGEPLPATAVDPTGAGDAFAAGLLAGWLAGAGPAAALRAGARLGAEAVARLGARPAG